MANLGQQIDYGAIVHIHGGHPDYFTAMSSKYPIIDFFLVVKRLYSLSKFDKENPLYGRIFTPRVSAMRLSLTPDSGLPLHPLNQVLGVLPIADAEDARTTQGDALPQ